MIAVLCRPLTQGGLLLARTRDMSPGTGEEKLNGQTARAIWPASGMKTDLVNLTWSSCVRLSIRRHGCCRGSRFRQQGEVPDRVGDI
jgi:hypothetical protein